MRSDDNRLVAVLRDLNQMIPDANDKQEWLKKRGVCETFVVAANERRQRNNKRTHLWRSSGSTPTVGSSKIKSSGSCMSATANETLRCWPPLWTRKRG